MVVYPVAVGDNVEIEMLDTRGAQCRNLPEFTFSPRQPRVAVERTKVQHPPAHMGPMAPPRPKARGEVNTKADPIWDVAFTTKFPRNKPAENEPLATPKGAAKVIHEFLSRVEELNYLASTQHLELATTLSEMKANGIDGFSLSAASDDDMEAANIADLHLKKTPFAVRLPDEEMTAEDGTKVLVPRYGDMVYAANMTRRIEWERFIWSCGPVHRVRFTQMRDGTLGIEYEGKEKDPEVILGYKRAMKQAWLRTHDALPSFEDIANVRAHLTHLRQPVLAMMTEDQSLEYISSKMYGTEEPDPQRVEFHAEPDPKPQREQYPFGDCRACSDTLTDHPNHRNCTILGWEMYGEDVERWEARQTNRGYAGPSGILGLDEDADDGDDEIDPIGIE